MSPITDEAVVPISVRSPEGFDRLLLNRLAQQKMLDQRSLERVQRLNRGTRDSVLVLLPKLGLVAERDLAGITAELLDIPLVGIADYPAEPLLEGYVNVRFLRDSRVLPLAEVDGAILLAMADPLDSYAIDAIRLAAGRPVNPCVAVPAELEAAIERLYGNDVARPGEEDGIASAPAEAVLEPDVEKLRDLASEAPVIRLVNQLIARASEFRASDIHIEPFENCARVRFRIDGELRDMEPLPERHRQAVISRIKIMARLDIAERRLPQDGRAKVAVRGTPIDLRVATMPTLHGEGVVMRLLDRRSVALDFSSLGMDGDGLDRLLSIVDRPNGVVLVTGPTGSGKTTTLYAALVRLNRTERKILTVEDPIEYQLDGINQTQVKPGIGLGFANVLRSFLRLDPDIIMVGEIRDGETAEIAVHAALTGHLVLSTLHTNSAAASITRLLDMGVQDYLITSTINGIAAQRLVRTLCPECRKAYTAMPELVRQLGLNRYCDLGDIQLYQPVGCTACNGTGFRGRTSLLETLVVTDPIRQLILQRPDANSIHRAAVEDGMRTLYDDGMTKALAGITTIEEVLQVTRDI